ncbi:hypothetical protein F5I97DRAFT_309571 [Phlebopus sp. FC_14]|nr:hypothetical protein F5I97DRAFT_309571 [Phlebopus sp. FC_14]
MAPSRCKGFYIRMNRKYTRVHSLHGRQLDWPVCARVKHHDLDAKNPLDPLLPAIGATGADLFRDRVACKDIFVRHGAFDRSEKVGQPRSTTHSQRSRCHYRGADTQAESQRRTYKGRCLDSSRRSASSVIFLLHSHSRLLQSHGLFSCSTMFTQLQFLSAFAIICALRAKKLSIAYDPAKLRTGNISPRGSVDVNDEATMVTSQDISYPLLHDPFASEQDQGLAT